MSIQLNLKSVAPFIREHEIDQMQSQVSSAHDLLVTGTGAGSAFLGWRTLPDDYDRAEFDRILAAASRIQKTCDILIVIGIGGSYLGARAVIDFLRSPLYNNLKKDTPDIYYAGNCISSASLTDLLSICEGRDVCLNVISKSGTTTEPAVAFRIFRNYLEKKYGKEEAASRIYVTTDRKRGTLKQFSDKAGYETFVVPDDVGGRFSVLSAVGLLPIAVSGIDIRGLMEGAADAARAYASDDLRRNDAYRYAAVRNILYRKGKTTEILVNYEPYATMLSEWWKQLFGESEGKDGKGIFPASVTFTTDLHSMGQFIQDGSRNLFETVICIRRPGTAAYRIPADPMNVDGLSFLDGKDLDEVRDTAMQGTRLAHTDGGVPNILIEMSGRDAHALGELLYFFETAVAISGYLLGVNPFDQPGVEAYKNNMYALLGKPGYEDRKKALEARLD